MTKIHHFYHVYADGDWLSKLSDHIRALKTYGLYEKLESFNIGCVGSDTNFNNVVTFLQENNVKCTIVAHSHLGWEQITLNHMWLHAKTHQNDIFLYCHTKGAANNSELNEIWRRGMTRKIVVEWEHCVSLLEQGHSTLGCHYFPHNPDNPNPFWGGNFWWATGEHINLLKLCGNNVRHEAESWIGTIYTHESYKPASIWNAPIASPTEGY